MNRAYFCDEQVGQMQATYDAITMVKMLHEAGIDVRNNPINYYCYGWGDQADIFHEAIKRMLFESCNQSYSDNLQGETWEYSIVFPEIEEMMLLSNNDEANELLKKVDILLHYECPNFEMGMSGVIKGKNIYIKITGNYGIYSNFLGRIIELRTIVLGFIAHKKKMLMQKIQNIFMMKMLSLSRPIPLGISIWAPTSFVFIQLMKTCGVDFSTEIAENLSPKKMCSLLRDVIKIYEKDEVA
ncbi:hypothetical protein [Paenibacillus sp. AGC30]